MTAPLWKPSKSAIESSQMAQFAKRASVVDDVADIDYQQLWQWSVENRQDFWQEIWQITCGSWRSGPCLERGRICELRGRSA